MSEKECLIENLKQFVQFKESSIFFRLIHSPWKILYPMVLNKLGKISETYTETFYGATLKIVLPEVVSVAIYRYGFFEEGLSLFLLQTLKPGQVFIDIGAHLGYYTVLASQRVSNSGKVIAFEPTPRTCTVLRDNVKNCGNVTVEPFAVWSTHKKDLFINDLGWIWSAHNSLFKPRLEKAVIAHPIQIQGIALDDYFTDNAIIPSMIKIDAESAELEILKGMTHTLTTHQPVISIEVGDFDLPDVPPSRKIIEFMLDHAYTPFEYRKGLFVEHSLSTRYGYNNIICVPNHLKDHYF